MIRVGSVWSFTDGGGVPPAGIMRQAQYNVWSRTYTGLFILLFIGG